MAESLQLWPWEASKTSGVAEWNCLSEELPKVITHQFGRLRGFLVLNWMKCQYPTSTLVGAVLKWLEKCHSVDQGMATEV
ncbi:hypothetical protein Y1Q_0021793 [Alligator mississippiensis]|uniref:Uncharacterized protein n=1 Tax=Alligator mississippiensis TaxID=8496 RepID=A0A151PBG3_ALLMI|nr:hypothetical protein Y1Q_0021793 [Alligator mississippiensis]